MSLRSVGGALLAVGGRLVRACCCRVLEYACVTTGVDSCGNEIVECQRVISGGQYATPDCDGQCPELPPCECNPPCDGCSECRDGECVPVYGVCEQCVDGAVVPLCGECETCSDGACVPCPEGHACVEDVCIELPPPGTYYCCYEYSESEGDIIGTTCQAGPCGKIVDGQFVLEPQRTAGGPYSNATACEDSCRPHDCTPTACGNVSCEPRDDGPFRTRDACLANCDDPDDGACGLMPADPFADSHVGAGTFGYNFTITPAAFDSGREICVSYVSTNAKPIRVQIWAPEMSPDGCQQLSDSVLIRDSQWRGLEQCNCGFDPPGGFAGTPKGTVRWSTKKKGVTSFEVRVLAECADNAWQIAVACGGCQPLPAYDCPCECGTFRPDIGCFAWPFGIEGDVAAALLTIEWCELTGSPYAYSIDGDGNLKSIEASRYPSESIIACYQDAGGDFHLHGHIAVGYGTNTCSASWWYYWDYKLDRDNDQGGEATVSLIRTIEFGSQPCGCEGLPTVTITLPP